MIGMLYYLKWKPIIGYEGLYEISDNGILHSFKRRYTCENYTFGGKCNKNYRSFTLRKNKVSDLKYVHHLVYEAFVGPIPEGYEIHHKNHIKNDNRLENLELIEHKEHIDLHSSEKTKPVLQFTKDGEFIAEYPSIREAERQTGICSSKISAVCKNKSLKSLSKGKEYSYVKKTAGGFIWKYK